VADTQFIDEIALVPGVDFGAAVNVTPLWDTSYLLPLLKGLAFHLPTVLGSASL
jgi:hypothetical protein